MIIKIQEVGNKGHNEKNIVDMTKVRRVSFQETQIVLSLSENDWVQIRKDYEVEFIDNYECGDLIQTTKEVCMQNNIEKDLERLNKLK